MEEKLKQRELLRFKVRNTLALLKNRHTERTGHPIGDWLTV